MYCNTNYWAFTVLLFTLNCFETAVSISCYQCNSHNNSMCLEPSAYDAETIDKYLRPTSCNQGPLQSAHQDFFCRKIVQTILDPKGKEPEVRITRGCGWVRSHRDCYKADNEAHFETVCQCFSDKCNGGPTAARAQAAVTALALTGLAMKLYIVV